MKTNQSPQRKAAALITTLILVSAVALVTVSFLTISRNEAQISGNRISNVRADLAERAAFEEAKNLLTSLTGNDHYLVSSQIEPSGNTDTVGTRYTFVTTPRPGGIEHVPLFAGGGRQSSSLANLDEAETASLIDSPPGKPAVDINANETISALEIFGLTHLNEDGEMKPEDRFPKTGLVDLPQAAGDRFRHRYTWWAEDLEGYPNIDVIGGWTDHFGNSGGDNSLDFIRPGYSFYDSRTLPASPASPNGLRIALAENTYHAWQFPKSFRGQIFTDQVAPGLSPREINLQPWETASIALQDHPFARAADLTSARHWLSSGGAYTRTTALKREHRFMVGLRDYVSVPRIPFNHSYADEGLPQHNLNQLVSGRIVSSNQNQGGFVEIVERNLEDFEESRKGGFPDDEDYLATLAANAIDYADEDSLATGPGSSTNDANYTFRGVDSYCPINEFFVKFQFEEIRDNGTEYICEFSADFYGEFWNPFHLPVEMSGLLLEVKLLDDLGFRYTAFSRSRGRISDLKRSDPKPNDTALAAPTNTGSIQPNSFFVHYFGKQRWEETIPKSEFPPFSVPVIQDLQAYSSSKSSSRITYHLTMLDRSGNRMTIDTFGRPDDPPLPKSSSKHGFFFNKRGGTLSPGDPLLRVAGGNHGMTRKNGSSPRMSGGHLGDPWMNYYARSTTDNSASRESEYKNRATPGFRNFDHSKVDSGSRKDVIKDQVRVRDWPDKGYDSDLAPHEFPRGNDELPTSFNSTQTGVIAPEALRAPFRISNQNYYYSTTELANLHDPVMWSSVPLDMVGPSSLALRYKTASAPATYFHDYPASFLGTISNATSLAKHSMWGGGNTLRIGRPEHPLFDRPNMRASQLLDLFQVGTTGTNLQSATGNPNQLYDIYDPRDHQPPPAAPNSTAATQAPFNRIYDERLHAESIFQKRHGHLNINSVPTVFEIEALLRGPFVSSDVIMTADDHITPNYKSAGELGIPGNSLRVDAIPDVARDLYHSRPFYSPSHLARVLSDSIRRHDAYPEAYNDAEAEETFARLYNTTSFSSRHFRVFTYGEVLPRDSDVVLSRSRKIYEIFMEPEHDDSGEVVRVRTRILSIRDL